MAEFFCTAETPSIPPSPILRSGPKASGLELFYFSSRATTQKVEGTVTYLNIFLRIVADPRQQFVAHQPLTGQEKDIDPVPSQNLIRARGDAKGRPDGSFPS